MDCWIENKYQYQNPVIILIIFFFVAERIRLSGELSKNVLGGGPLLSESEKINSLEYSCTAKMVHGPNRNLSASYSPSPLMSVLVLKLHHQHLSVFP
jgi:hypothetical protein